ncbi:MAG: hypothetical protein QXM52_01950 [Candidatus Bathyarchaeia archaeon]
MSSKDPPILTTYKGRKIETMPNAISWKKNPSRHIARKPLGPQLKLLLVQIKVLYKVFITLNS